MSLSKNYLYLPEEFHKAHDYCEFVVSHIEDLIINDKFNELKSNEFKFSSQIIKEIELDNNHFLDVLEKYEYNDIIFHLIKNTLLNSLIIETCYFLQESLECSLKMRLTVCFTLLRKPFLEVLIILMRILNEVDFIEKFNYTDGFDPIKTSPDYKKQLIEETNEKLFDRYHTNDLFNYIFAKDFSDSLFNLTNNSIHLYTDRNPISATGKQDLNFIFNTKNDINNQWEYFYENLPMLISFIADITDLLVYKSTSLNEEVFMERMEKRERLRMKNKIQ